MIHQLCNSVFLQALGYAIAHSLWQVALVWLVYVGITHTIRLTAAKKYNLAILLQLTSFIWFVSTFQFYYKQCNIQANAFVSDGQVGIISLTNQTDFWGSIIHTMFKAETCLPFLSIAYLLLLGFLATKWMMGYRATQLLRNSGLSKMPIDFKLFVQQTSFQLGIKQQVKVYLSNLVQGPITMGFLKPIILLPVACINQLSTEQVEAILLHELAHIKRMDYLINLIMSLIETVLFFNPFTQLLAKAIQAEREHDCDDWVLQFKYSAATYAQALLNVALIQQKQQTHLAMHAAQQNQHLLLRVKRMMNQPVKHRNYKQYIAALLLLTFGMSMTSVWQAKQPQTNAIKVTKYIPEPMSAHIDNPLFNPIFFLNEPIKKEIKQSLDVAEKEAANNPEVLANIQIAKAAMLSVHAAMRAANEPQMDEHTPLQEVVKQVVASNDIVNSLETSDENTIIIDTPTAANIYTVIGHALPNQMKLDVSNAGQQMKIATHAMKNVFIFQNKQKLKVDTLKAKMLQLKSLTAKNTRAYEQQREIRRKVNNGYQYGIENYDINKVANDFSLPANDDYRVTAVANPIDELSDTKTATIVIKKGSKNVRTVSTVDSLGNKHYELHMTTKDGKEKIVHIEVKH